MEHPLAQEEEKWLDSGLLCGTDTWKENFKQKKNFFIIKKSDAWLAEVFWRMASEDHIASGSSSSKSFFTILSPSRLVSTGRPGCRNRNQDRV